VFGLYLFDGESLGSYTESLHFDTIICDLDNITPKVVEMSAHKITLGHPSLVYHSLVLRSLDTHRECLLIFVTNLCGRSALPFASAACTFKDIFPRGDSCFRVVMDENGLVSLDESLCLDC
jgi:hypothetical protein